MMTQAVALMLFPAAMAFAASSDLLTMTISNKVSLVLVLGFFVLAAAIGMSAADILNHVAASLLVLMIVFTCFAFGWIGGGDAKLAAATALWLGLDHLLVYFVYASLFGGALTLLLLKFRNMNLPPIVAAQEWVDRLHRMDSGVPYGIALAASALTVYPDTVWMRAIVA